MDGTVVIQFDYNKNKLRAVNEDEGGFVRFPNKLRTEEGLRYWVEELGQGKSGSWIAKGKIVKLSR